MAKVRVTIELDETLFAWEDNTDLLRYAYELVLDSIYDSSEYQDIVRINKGRDDTNTDITVTKLEYLK